MIWLVYIIFIVDNAGVSETRSSPIIIFILEKMLFKKTLISFKTVIQNLLKCFKMTPE